MACYTNRPYIKCLVLDSHFFTRIYCLWCSGKKKNCDWSTFDFSSHSALQDYVLGDYLFCSLPFCVVDILLVPIFIPRREHWALGYVELKDHCIRIYDSLSSKRVEKQVLECVQSLAVILPHLLESVGYFDSHTHEYFTSQFDRLEPFEIIMDDCPRQENGLVFVSLFNCFFFVFPLFDLFLHFIFLLFLIL